MNELDTNILFFLIVFILIFLIDYFLILKRKLNIILEKKKSKKNKKVDIMEITYLSSKFKIDKNKLYKTVVILWISFIDSFIISLVATVINFVPLNMGFQLLIGFALLFSLIYSLYEIFGRILIKKLY